MAGKKIVVAVKKGGRRPYARDAEGNIIKDENGKGLYPEDVAALKKGGKPKAATAANPKVAPEKQAKPVKRKKNADPAPDDGLEKVGYMRAHRPSAWYALDKALKVCVRLHESEFTLSKEQGEALSMNVDKLLEMYLAELKLEVDANAAEWEEFRKASAEVEKVVKELTTEDEEITDEVEGGAGDDDQLEIPGTEASDPAGDEKAGSK